MFSIEKLIAELTEHTPHLQYELLIKLGQGRYQSQATVPSMKAIMALCTLMKGRSTMVLGLQMLITFMLIARASMFFSYYSTHNITYNANPTAGNHRT